MATMAMVRLSEEGTTIFISHLVGLNNEKILLPIIFLKISHVANKPTNKTRHSCYAFKNIYIINNYVSAFYCCSSIIKYLFVKFKWIFNYHNPMILQWLMFRLYRWLKTRITTFYTEIQYLYCGLTNFRGTINFVDFVGDSQIQTPMD